MDFEMKYYDIMKGFRRIVIAAVVFAAAGISASAQLSFQGGVTLPIQTFEEPGSQGFACGSFFFFIRQGASIGQTAPAFFR